MHYVERHFRNLESDALKNIIDNTDAEFRILAAGPRNASLWRLNLDDIAIDSAFLQFPVFIKFTVPHDKVLVGIEMMDASEVFVNNRWSSNSSIELYPPGTEVQCLSRTGGQSTGILLSLERLQTSAISMGYKEIDWPCIGTRAILLKKNTIQSIRREIKGLIKLGKQLSATENNTLVSNMAAEGLTQLLASVIAEPHPSHHPGCRLSKRRQYALAAFESKIDDLLKHPGKKLELSNLSGSSKRMLERAAREVYGVTPYYWLRLARLNAAYKELIRNENTTVSYLAERWGFGHAGRFSRFYYEIFGEVPSETSRRLRK